jgi:hypothetical protein
MATLEGIFLDRSTLEILRKAGNRLETTQRNYFAHQLVLDGSFHARCDQSSYRSFMLLHVACSFPPALHVKLLHSSYDR